jgi:hypothetical protein
MGHLRTLSAFIIEEGTSGDVEGLPLAGGDL